MAISLAKRIQIERVLLRGSVILLLLMSAGYQLTHPQSRQQREPQAVGFRLSLNRASAEELTVLPGIGPGKGKAIVSHRDAGHTLHTLSDADQVAGIGPVTMELIQPWVVEGQ